MNKLIRSRFLWFFLTCVPVFVVNGLIFRPPEFASFLMAGIQEVVMLWLMTLFAKKTSLNYFEWQWEKFRYGHTEILLFTAAVLFIALVMSFDIEALMGVRLHALIAEFLCLLPQL